MAVAEREDEVRHRAEILAADLKHLLNIGHHLDKLAVVKHKKIVGAQGRRCWKIELDARAFAAEHEALLPTTVVEFQQQRIDDLANRRFKLRPRWNPAWRSLAENLLRTRHDSATNAQRRGARSPPRSNGRTAAFSEDAAEPSPAFSAGSPSAGCALLPWAAVSASRRT